MSKFDNINDGYFSLNLSIPFSVNPVGVDFSRTGEAEFKYFTRKCIGNGVYLVELFRLTFSFFHVIKKQTTLNRRYNVTTTTDLPPPTQRRIQSFIFQKTAKQ